MSEEKKQIPKRVLFCGFWQEHHKTALSNHLKKFSYDLVGLVSHHNYLAEHDPIFISQRGIYRHNTFLDNPGQELPPGKIIEQLRDVESTCLKMMDRNYKSPIKYRRYEFRKRTYLAQLASAYSILTTHRFDQVLFSLTPHNTFDYIIHHLAQRLGIKSSFFAQIQVKDSFFHATDIKQIYHQILPALENNPSTDLPEHLENEIADRNGSSKPFYMTRANLSWKQIIYRKQKRILRLHSYTQTIFAIPPYLSYLTCPKLHAPPKSKYVYFALHFQPEATTSPMGGIYVDQYFAILMLARSLPEGVDVVVKEHPRQRMWQRTCEFYSVLKAEKNVKFAHKKVDSLELTRNSLAVATITGTVGWEAIFNKKPVFIFGNVFYRFLKGVVHVTDQNSITAAIDQIESDKFEYASEQNIRAYLSAIHQVSYTGVVDAEYFRNSRFSKEESTRKLEDVLGTITT